MAYDVNFESPLLRGEDIDSRPWDLQGVILDTVHPYDNVLDIGCGTGLKLLGIAADVRSVVGLEPNADMRARAAQHVAETALQNVEIVEGACEEIPYSDGSFDVVTSMMAPHVISEMHRVLKPGGVVILEQLGEQDKNVIKASFPRDEAGPRGLLSGILPNQRAIRFQEEFEAVFSNVQIRSGFWSTLIPPEGLDLLLATTPTIRDFDPIKDQASVQKIKEQCAVADGRIQMTQHRLLITATKELA
jgi:SAM-dependent methyltransferase